MCPKITSCIDTYSAVPYVEIVGRCLFIAMLGVAVTAYAPRPCLGDEKSSQVAVGGGAELLIAVDGPFGMVPQKLTINRGDSIRWTSPTRHPTTVATFDDEFELQLSESTGWSASFRFNTPGTNVYRRYWPDRDPDIMITPTRAGMVVVRDWTNAPPLITINSPVEGDVFNCCGSDRELVSLLATPAIGPGRIARVEFLSGDSIVATVTNSPYFTFHRDLPPGKHRLVARVVESGDFLESTPVHIETQEVFAAKLEASTLRLGNQELVMANWIEPPVWTVMLRDESMPDLGSRELSSTSSPFP